MKAFDIDELCAAWAAGEQAKAIGARFSVSRQTAERYGRLYSTEQQKADRHRVLSERKNPRNGGKSTGSQHTKIWLQDPVEVDWTGFRFEDDPVAVEADRYGRMPLRPAAHVPAMSSAA